MCRTSSVDNIANREHCAHQSFVVRDFDFSAINASSRLQFVDGKIGRNNFCFGDRGIQVGQNVSFGVLGHVPSVTNVEIENGQARLP